MHVRCVFVTVLLVLSTFLQSQSVEGRSYGYGQEQQSSEEIGQSSQSLDQSQSESGVAQTQQGTGDLQDTNSEILFEGLDEQQQVQLGKDTEKYEHELEVTAAKGGHKGKITVDDAQIVEEKNQDKPWYRRLQSWTGKKLQQLTNAVKGTGYKRESTYY